MIHATANAATLAALVLILVLSAGLLAGYWPRIVNALKGKGGHA